MRGLLGILWALLPARCEICHSWWCSPDQHCPECHEVRVKFQWCPCDHKAEFRRILARAERKVFAEAAEEAERLSQERELDLLADRLDLLEDKVRELLQQKRGDPQ